MTTTLIGASPEVIGHHTRQHARRCPTAGVTSSWCPCGTTVALICTSCDQAVFLAARETCPHLVEAVDRG